MNTATGVRTPLHIGFSDLSIGSYSVGLPLSRTSEQVVEAYIDLISLVRPTRPDSVRQADVEALAGETNLDMPFITNRVNLHLAR